MAKIHYIHEVPRPRKNGEDLGSTYRDATKKEIRKAKAIRDEFKALMSQQKQIEARIKELIGNCKHIVVHDEAGYIYDTRTCLACGHNDYL